MFALLFSYTALNIALRFESFAHHCPDFSPAQWLVAYKHCEYIFFFSLAFRFSLIALCLQLNGIGYLSASDPILSKSSQFYFTLCHPYGQAIKCDTIYWPHLLCTSFRD